jgi:hypothetical protein
MGLTPITSLEFARMMVRLWPSGKFRRDPESVNFRLMHAFADELARHHQRQIDLLNESDPRTTSELLPEWEKQYGLTDSSGTDEERRARLQTRILSLFDFSARPEDYQRVMAPILDTAAILIEVIEISAAEAAAANNPRLVYQFYIWRDPALPGTPDLVFAQSELDRIKHSHTRGFIIETKAMIVNDPQSIVNRDIIGV